METKKIFASIVLLFVLTSCSKDAIETKEGLTGNNEQEHREYKKEKKYRDHDHDHDEEHHDKEYRKQKLQERVNKAKEQVNTTETAKTSDNTADNTDADKTLQINPSCIGCGHCVVIAPENFKMDFDTRKAVVISQEDIYSDKVTESIKICPVDAIGIM